MRQRGRCGHQWVRLGNFALVVLLSVGFGPMRPSAAELLEALEQCPSGLPTCLTMRANLKWPGARSDSVGDHAAVVEVDERVRESDYGQVIVRIVGRLDGGEPRPYRLRLAYPVDAVNCNDFTVAAMGAGESGGGVIVTRQGVLEVLSLDIMIGSRRSVAVIDRDRAAATFRLAPGWEQAFWGAALIATGTGRILWRVGDACLDLEAQGGFRQVGTEECEGEEISPAPSTEVRRVKDAGIFTDAHEVERLDYDLWRVQGTPFLLYIYGVACT